MLKKKVRRDYVIRAQKEVIQAQDALIEWLLRLVENGQSDAELAESQTPSEVRNGHD
jgi:hypothetical protein